MNITINEVHPYPESGNEWVELFVNQELTEELNLNNYTLFDSIRLIHKFTDEKFSKQFLVVEVNGLNNDTDSVILKDSNNNILDIFTYEKTEKGLSWSKNFSNNTFVLSTSSRGLTNPNSTPTPISITPILTPTTTHAPTSAPTNVTPSTTTTPVITKTNSTTTNTIAQKLISPDKIKLSIIEKNYRNRNLRLVFLGELPERGLIINAIIGSLLIILGSVIFIYGKIKNHHSS